MKRAITLKNDKSYLMTDEKENFGWKGKGSMKRKKFDEKEKVG